MKLERNCGNCKHLDCGPSNQFGDRLCSCRAAEMPLLESILSRHAHKIVCDLHEYQEQARTCHNCRWWRQRPYDDIDRRECDNPCFPMNIYIVATYEYDEQFAGLGLHCKHWEPRDEA